MTITAMLDKYSAVDRVSGISAMERKREPEIQRGEHHAFDYVLKSEESAIRKGECKYTKDGSVYRKK